MNQQSWVGIVGFLLLAPTAPVAAQQPPDPAPALVRIAPRETVIILDTEGRRLVGSVAQVSSGGLTLVQRGQTMSVPLQRVARVTIADSNRNGAAIGGLIGAVVGAVGGFAVNAICANEGGGCFGVVLALTGAGAAGGAGIGWLGDRLHQPSVYARPGAPRELAPEMGVTFITDSRGGLTTPGIGGSLGVTSHSGLGFEVHVDRSMAGRNGQGEGTSFDGRVLYVFGNGRYRPYGLAGAGYFEYVGRAYTQLVPAMGSFPERRIEGRFRPQGFAPLVGGGVRVGITSKISIRPEVLWYPQPGGAQRAGLRASVGVGFGW